MLRTWCIRTITEKFGDKLSDDEISAIVDHVTAKANVSADIANAQSKLVEKARAVAKETVKYKLVERRSALLNAKAYIELHRKIAQFEDPHLGLMSVLTGTIDGKAGTKFSVNARQKAYTGEFLGKIVGDLEKQGVLTPFVNGSLDDEIAGALFEMKPGGNPSKHGDVAEKIANVIHKHQVAVVKRLNDAGAWIDLEPGYIARQSHNPTKIRRSKEEWFNMLRETLDMERTLNGADEEEFFESAFEAVSTGVHLRNPNVTDKTPNAALFAMKGFNNKAKQLSHSRVFHFKDSASWMKYNDAFGYSNLRESIVKGFMKSADDLAMMETFGTNPEYMFEKIVDSLKKKHRTANPDAVDKLSKRSLKYYFDEIAGNTNFAENVNMARVGMAWRAWLNMAYLGKLIMTALPDVPNMVRELHYQGMPLFKSYGIAIENILKGRSGEVRKEIARRVGVAVDGSINTIAARFSIQDDLPGRIAKMQQLFFKLNLMEWWDESHRSGVAIAMANEMGDNGAKNWDSLPSKYKHLLEQYDIEQQDWEAIRNLSYVAGDGRTYLTPERIHELPDEDVMKMFDIPKHEVTQFKNRIESKFRSMIMDRIDYAIFRPDSAERAFMKRGTRPGTFEGEFLRLGLQFKTYPIVSTRKGIGRDLYGGQNPVKRKFFKPGRRSARERVFDGFTYLPEVGKEMILEGRGDMFGLAHMIVGTGVMGFASLSLKAIGDGKEIPTENVAKIIQHSLLQGGGLGIYGDFLFGDYNRFGGSFTSTLMGPTFGAIDDVASLWTRFRNGDETAAQAFRIAYQKLPYSNLFYTKAALDYLIKYNVLEAIEPGYLSKYQRSIKRDTGQDFFFPPSAVIGYGGFTR